MTDPTPTDEIAALRRELEEWKRVHEECGSDSFGCSLCEHMRNRLRELGEKV